MVRVIKFETFFKQCLVLSVPQLTQVYEPAGWIYEPARWIYKIL